MKLNWHFINSDAAIKMRQLNHNTGTMVTLFNDSDAEFYNKNYDYISY